jgi:RNA recognition motif-containing protein
MQNKLFVRNLSFNTDDAELQALFADFGDVVSARVAVDRDSGRGRGFGFVEMGSQQAAEQAIRALDSTEFGGRTIHVAVSEPRERRPNSGNW